MTKHEGQRPKGNEVASTGIAWSRRDNWKVASYEGLQVGHSPRPGGTQESTMPSQACPLSCHPARNSPLATYQPHCGWLISDVPSALRTTPRSAGSFRLWPSCFVIPRRARQRHLPMQNWLKMESRRSSVEVLPTISPTAPTATRRSAATSSKVRPPARASVARIVAVRVRWSAS